MDQMIDPDREYLILKRGPARALREALGCQDASLEEIRRLLLRACRGQPVTWEQVSCYGIDRVARLEIEYAGRRWQFIACFTRGVDRYREPKIAPDGVKRCVFFSGAHAFRPADDVPAKQSA